MAFIQDPRMRQRWNEIQHTTETVTENAAAGIWTFQHRYITPCFASVCNSLDACSGLCIGDREERARRARERDRGARRSRAPEYTFDFYDDWDEDLVVGGGSDAGDGILGSWGGGRREDWDRLLAGTGSVARRGADPEADVVEHQPRRKRGMSYGGTRGGAKRKLAAEEDPTVIPSTAPLGFLGRLPFKIGGTLRYKPSAANLKEHPGHPEPHQDEARDAEHQPLLGGDEEEEHIPELSIRQLRTRSNTVGSGATSDSYRSRNDLFPSDGEGEEDAVPLDDEFAVALDRVDADRGSTRTRSTKGKNRADGTGTRSMSRTVSKSTMASSTRGSIHGRGSFTSINEAYEVKTPSLEDLRREEEEARREEDEELERRREAARQLARERGLSVAQESDTPVESQVTAEMTQVDGPGEPPRLGHDGSDEEDVQDDQEGILVEELSPGGVREQQEKATPEPAAGKAPIDDTTAEEFVPARLPHFR